MNILRKMFPCGSITGAPKVKAMEIIKTLEKDPRGLYTGAVGYLAPSGKVSFNVAIRTVVVDTEKGSAEYGVGGGIVWDSNAREEYEECQAKAAVLARESTAF
jgi:para-aminobenzoate synthetase/4-amino-4-deoxychorismate lyase